MSASRWFDHRRWLRRDSPSETRTRQAKLLAERRRICTTFGCGASHARRVQYQPGHLHRPKALWVERECGLLVGHDTATTAHIPYIFYFLQRLVQPASHQGIPSRCTSSHCGPDSVALSANVEQVRHFAQHRLDTRRCSHSHRSVGHFAHLYHFRFDTAGGAICSVCTFV